MFMEILDEVAWDLQQIAQNSKHTCYMPEVLSEQISEQARKLQEVYNEFCMIEENV